MKISTVIAGMMVSLVMSYIVYFGFTTNYTAHNFSKASFTEQFDHDVFKYRIVSKYLLLKTDEVLTGIFPEQKPEWRLLVQDRRASDRFYYAFFLLNTLFLLLNSIVLAFLLEMDHIFALSKGEKRLLLFFLPTLICLTQYVVVPYDISSYFFELLTIYIFLEYIDRYYWASLSICGLLLALATLNRESSAMTASFLFIISFYKWGLSRLAWASTFLITVCFLVPYLALRHFIQDPGWFDPHYVDKFQLNLYWEFCHWGALFWVLMIWLTIMLCRNDENRSLVIWYYVACLPYIVTCVVTGILWETRLYIPVFMGAVFMGQIDTSRFQSPLAMLARKTGWL